MGYKFVFVKNNGINGSWSFDVVNETRILFYLYCSIMFKVEKQ